MGGRDYRFVVHAAPSYLLILKLYRQNFITFMDALKLRLRAKDQLHPILQDLVTGYARFKGSKDWEGRSQMVGWYVREPRYPCRNYC